MRSCFCAITVVASSVATPAHRHLVERGGPDPAHPLLTLMGAGITSHQFTSRWPRPAPSSTAACSPAHDICLPHLVYLFLPLLLAASPLASPCASPRASPLASPFLRLAVCLAVRVLWTCAVLVLVLWTYAVYVFVCLCCKHVLCFVFVLWTARVAVDVCRAVLVLWTCAVLVLLCCGHML